MTAPVNAAESALEALISRLHRRGRLRVWSLVITIFGDAILPRGGRVPLAVLQELLARLRIEPGALRTAVSRLASDGWVIREKEGRNSFYRLDERGRHAFDLATRRIYAAGPPDWAGEWTIGLANPGATGDGGAALRAAGFIRLAGGVYLRPETAASPDARKELAGMLVIHGSSAEHPETLRALWPSADIDAAYRAVAASFAPLATALDGGASLPPLDAMAARTLLIHDWRRIVLRDPGLPAALLPEDWAGKDARNLARGIYAKLTKPSEQWLDKSGLPPLSDQNHVAHRFGH
jgi:phenylacetic acid degradation operon negative regulatory protein